MDFLDSLDLDVSNKKSRRVRSWYLYEQFKSLERNQIDAARQLKDRSYQDRILRQELSERKARRKLYDQIGVSRTASQTQSVKSESIAKTPLNASCSDLLDGLHDVDLDEIVHDLEARDDPQTGKYFDTYTGPYGSEDFKSIEEPNNSSTESIASVLDVNPDTDKNIQREEKLEKMDLNFEEVKEKLHCLERLVQMGDKSAENESLYSIDEKEIKNDNLEYDKHENTADNNIFLMWSKLVSFAYQLMQLNHGNCYYDYGSQFLTAVLACDVLRRGLNRVCYILQPYVSPIKFATDTVLATEINKNDKRKTNKHSPRHKPQKQSKSFTKCMHARKFRSDLCGVSSRCQENSIHQRYRRRSEPWDRSPISERSLKSSYHSIWPFFSDEENVRRKSLDYCKCGRRKVVLNPMLKLSQYLDSIMKDIEYPVF